MIDHTAVLPNETLEYLTAGADTLEGEYFVDGTFGAGEHSRALLTRGATVIGFDWDSAVHEAAKTPFQSELSTGQLVLIQDSFANLPTVLADVVPKHQDISGFLFDFGTNSEQLTSSERGFSVQSDGPLDMRMDPRKTVTAHDILVAVPEKQLALLFREFGGEEQARAIAKSIKEAPIPQSTGELVERIMRVKRAQSGRLHPATKVFQALRIAVNTELDEITHLLSVLPTLASPQSRVVCISFHEGEDRLVKQAFAQWEHDGLGTRQTKKPIRASEQELATNPRARSAKLRAFGFTSV